MLLIPCPYCGPRAEDEFVCGGEGHIDRPVPAETVSETAWAEYLFYHDNPRGPLNERWLHAFGCGQWFHVVRDTATHAIGAPYPITGGKPQEAA
jgi:sarcosine oxidase subunit delta